MFSPSAPRSRIYGEIRDKTLVKSRTFRARYQLSLSLTVYARVFSSQRIDLAARRIDEKFREEKRPENELISQNTAAVTSKYIRLGNRALSLKL